MTDIHLDHEALRKHANNLLRAADEIDSIRSSASGINLGDGAFGIMCAMLPPIINSTHPDRIAVLSSTSHVLEESAQALKDAADDTFETDTEIASGLNRLESRLGSI